MFKKTLVASALTLAALGAHAANVAITPAVVSQEGAVGQANIAVPAVVATLTTNYTLNDEITFTITGAEFDTAGSVPVLNAALAGGDAATLSLLDTQPGFVKFRVTASVDGAADGVVYVGGTFSLTGMATTTATTIESTGNVTVAYSATAAGTGSAIDTAGTNSATAITVATQYASSITKDLDGVIDVNFDRQQFTAGDDTIETDVLVVTPTDSTPAVHPGTYTGATYVIKGDYSWMETDGDAGIDAGELAAAFDASGAADTYTSVIDSEASAITVTVTDAGGGSVEAATFEFTVAGAGTDNAVLEVQDFTIDSTLAYTTAAAASATKATQSAASAGSWTLNGAQAFYNYVPVGFAGLQNNLVFSNSGVKDGEVVIEAFDDAGNEYGPVTVSDMLMGGTNMTLTSPMIQEYLTVPSGTRLSVTATINAPADDVEFSGYTQKAGTGRQSMAVFAVE